MKRFLIIILVFCILILVAAVSVKPLAISIAKKQLGSVFAESRVLIGGASLRPARGLTLFEIELERKGVYKIKLKEAGIRYSLFSLIKRKPFKFLLSGIDVHVNAPKTKVVELSRYFNLPKGGPSIFGPVEVKDLNIDLNTQDLDLKAVINCDADLIRQSIEYFDLKMAHFSMFGVSLENGSFGFGSKLNQGKANVQMAKYNKLSITDIRGKIKLEDKTLSLYEISAKILDGEIQGDAKLSLGADFDYQIKLNCVSLDTAGFVREFEMRDKFEMTGKLNGRFELEGRNADIKNLMGDFSALTPGGTLVIKDEKMLENMAKSTKQPVDILVESFKNYHYNTGLMSLGLRDGNIIFKVNLEGEAGKRDLEVVMHGLF